MNIQSIEGDLLNQPVEVIVNAWNRNLIPWWLLLPQGISGAIKKKAGTKPFKELRKFGVLPLGGAAVTSAGNLPYKAIIHVAGISHLWISSEKSIRNSVQSALEKAQEKDFKSIAFPLIGAGTGGFKPNRVKEIIEDEISKSEYNGEVLIVTYKPEMQNQAG